MTGKVKNLLVFTLGIVVFLMFLITPVLFANPKSCIAESFRYSALTFYGRSATDLAQDIVGFRAMVRDENAYPDLGLAHLQLGLDFPLDAQSTHLPTTFLFVAPVAFLPWNYASIAWAILMLLGIIMTLKVYGLIWPQAIGYGLLSILWLPMMMSFGQLTILWLLFMTVAYKTRHDKPFMSGFFIGMASLVKLYPAIMIGPYFLQKKWKAVFGFLVAGSLGLVSVLVISPRAIIDYMNLEQNIKSTILRSDNSSLFNVGYQNLGVIGLIIVVIVFCVFLGVNRKHFFFRGQTIQDQSWMLWTFLSVVLLPVVWVYSLVPLLPVILQFVRSQNVVVKLIGWASIIVPVFGCAWGDKSVPYVAGITLLIGLGITMTNRIPGCPSLEL